MRLFRPHFLVVHCAKCVCLQAVVISVLYLSGCRADEKSTKWSSSYPAGQDCITEQRGRVASRGIIMSANYPLPYPAGKCYMWFISARTPGEIITISFSDLDLHSGPNGDCSLDFIEIGPSHEEYTQCGSLPDNYPPPFISFKSNAWVRFVTAPSSGVSGSRRGFSLTYIIGSVPAEKCEDDEFRCNNSKCILKNWQCNGGDECGDGSDEAGCKEIIKPTRPPDDDCGEGRFLCWSAVTNEQVCFMNIQKCNGKVDCFGGEDEKDCEKQKVCGGILTSHDSGSFTTPNFPLNYPPTVNCEWLIIVPETDVIQLRFDVFKLESGYDTDYVVIYDGRDENSDELGKYYGSHSPPSVVESSSYKMFIKFHSDASIPQQGFNVTYQVKGVCLVNQHQCGFNEKECYEPVQRCDGTWDCPIHGGDERGCGGCKPAEFACDKESQCYAEKDRCNGKGKCHSMSDEKDCTPALCGPLNGTFLCKNGRCIQETWQCDGQADCDDKSDEVNCPVTTRVVTAAVIGSLVCGLLLVIALGCTCKLYAMRMQDRYGGRYETPLTRIQNHLGRRRAPPPYNEAMITSRPYEEVERERREQLLQQGQQATGNSGENGRRGSGNRHGRPVEPTASGAATSSTLDRISSDTSLSQGVDVITAGCVAQWRRMRPNKHVRQNAHGAQSRSGGSEASSSQSEAATSACGRAPCDSIAVAVDSDAAKTDDTQQSVINSDGTQGGASVHRVVDRGSVSSGDSQLIDMHESQSEEPVPSMAQRRGSVVSVESTCSDTRLLLS